MWISESEKVRDEFCARFSPDQENAKLIRVYKSPCSVDDTILFLLWEHEDWLNRMIEANASIPIFVVYRDENRNPPVGWLNDSSPVLMRVDKQDDRSVLLSALEPGEMYTVADMMKLSGLTEEKLAELLPGLLNDNVLKKVQFGDEIYYEVKEVRK